MASRFPDKYETMKETDVRVLFVIEDEERNICDQKWIEHQIYQAHKIKSMRMTFSQIYERAKVDPETKVLTIDGYEIGFVYYRTGYQLEQHHSESDWEARKLLELAMPIKCPSIDVHLTTFKKFQQAFSDEDLLKRVMVKSLDEAEKIKHLFEGIWSLEEIDQDDFKHHDIIQKAIENPRNYVLKPQKEGGGNNFYDEDVKHMLLSNEKKNLKQFLIMERINTPEVKAFMLRNGKVLEALTCSELGVFSSVMFDIQKDTMLENRLLGLLFRTKGIQSNEGGVNSGYSVID